MKSTISIRSGVVAGIISVAVAVLFAACPAPIDVGVAQQLGDVSGPSIAIVTPTDDSTYLQTVTVTGNASDPGGSIRELHYTVTGVLGVLTDGTVPATEITTDGTFSFSFSAIGFSGPIQVRVDAVDWNDNVESTFVSLQYSGSQLSSFEAEAGSKTVSLSWEGLPDADSYTIYYTDNGTLPSETYGTRIDVSGTSHELSGLGNGLLHVFLLSANVDGDPVYWSNYRNAIPLSEFTLAPQATAGYREISLEWQAIGGTNAFELYRSTAPEGPYTNHTGIITGNSFVDTGVLDGVWYYYKVKPSLADAPLSTYNAARTIAVPDGGDHVSSISVPAATRKTDVSGDYAYVAAGTAGLLVIDVSTPANPIHVGSVATVDATDVAIDGSVAYVADGAGGLVSVDVSNPSAPFVLDTVAAGSEGAIADAQHIDIDPVRDIVLLVDVGGDTVLYAFDVSDPGNLTELDSHIDGAQTFGDVAVSNESSTLTMVYLIGSEVLFEWYVSSAESFVLYRTYTPPVDAPIPTKVAVDDTHAYTLSVVPFDIEPPSEYQLWVYSRYYIGASPLPAFTDVGRSDGAGVKSGYVADLAVQGGRAFAVDEYSFHIYDISDKSAPDPVYSYNTPGGPLGIAVDAEYGYIATGTRFFQTIDLNLPTTPTVVGEYTVDPVTDLRMREAFVFATTSDSPHRLQILDVSDPTSPVESGSVPLDARSGIALSGDYAFLADGSYGLKIVDISTPGSPTQVGSVPPNAGTLYAVDVLGDYAYVAGSAGVEVFDISDPSAPVDVALLDSDPGGINDVEVHRGRLYALDGAYFQPTSLRIYDISNPRSPVLADQVTGVATDVSRFDISGTFAYITDQLGGLSAIDIDPLSGSYLTQYGPTAVDGQPAAATVTAFAEFAFVANPASGLTLMDVSNKSSTTTISATGGWSGNPEVVRLYGDLVFVADQSVGLKIVSLAD